MTPLKPCGGPLRNTAEGDHDDGVSSSVSLSPRSPSPPTPRGTLQASGGLPEVHLRQPLCIAMRLSALPLLLGPNARSTMPCPMPSLRSLPGLYPKAGPVPLLAPHPKLTAVRGDPGKANTALSSAK